MTPETNIGPGVREDSHTGQFVPTINGKDTSPTSFDPERAMRIAEEQMKTSSGDSAHTISAALAEVKEPLHIYDWLDLPPANDAERDAKEWLNKYCKPAYTKYKEGIDKWLARYRVTVTWKGKRFTCSGASRLGDVWIKSDESSNYYDHRVLVEELSDWKRITLPQQ